MSPALRLAVLHDPVAQDDPPDRQDALLQARAVAAALARLGHAPLLVPFGPDLAALRAGLEALRPDAVFNLVESVAGLDCLAFAAPALATALGLPVTGSPAAALLDTTGKTAVKRRLRAAGLPTPDWLAGPSDPSGLDDPEPGRGTYLLKPDLEHGSVGIGPEALVQAKDAAELAALLGARAKALGLACLAEAYVHGREWSVSVLGPAHSPEALPPAEMVFSGAGPGAGQDGPRILCYDAKWREQSAAYQGTVRAFPGPGQDTELTRRLAALACSVWRLFGLAGYARVDFRVDEAGQPFIIDVNANPCLAPDAGLAAAAGQAGLGFDQLAARILAIALGTDAPQAKDLAPAPGPDKLSLRSVVRPGDAAAIRSLVAATGHFNAEEIAVAGELAQEHLAKGEASGYSFILAEDASGLLGYACYGPVPGTEASFDLYWIAVRLDLHRQGLGGRILALAEADMAQRGAHGIYAETASREQYLPTRRFYERHGYVAHARLPDFYAPGDDKIIYSKTAPRAHTEKPWARPAKKPPRTS